MKRVSRRRVAKEIKELLKTLDDAIKQCEDILDYIEKDAETYATECSVIWDILAQLENMQDRLKHLLHETKARKTRKTRSTGIGWMDKELAEIIADEYRKLLISEAEE